MAGFRTFATGEVLTAANVNNFLMGQSVMRFADADARTAALGTDVVEGMLTYNLATDQLEVFDGTNFVVAAPAGIGSNVGQTVKTDTFSTTSSTFIDVTGLTVSITPSSGTSKIFVVALIQGSSVVGAANSRLIGRVVRDAVTLDVGDVAGDRTRAAFDLSQRSEAGFAIQSATCVFVDSPATTLSITYKVQIVTPEGGNTHINRSSSDADAVFSSRVISSISAIEVAA